MYLDADRRPSGEIPPQAKPTGRVLPFPGAPTPQIEAPATPARKLRDEAKPKPRKYAWGDKVREDENLSANAKVAAWYLCGLFDVAEESAFAMQATIAKRTGMKPKTVQRAMRELETAGYLRRELGAGNVGQNKYRPDWSKLSDTPSQAVTSDPQGGQISPPRVVTSGRQRRTDLTTIRQAENQGEEKQTSGAQARELPASLSEDDDRRQSQAVKVPLAADYQFSAEAVAAAKAAPRCLSESDITRALTGFRKRAGDGLDTPAGWAKRGAAYLVTVEAKPDPDEMVHVSLGNLCGTRKCRRSEVKPWESYTDSRGVRHRAKVAKRLSLAGTTTAV